MSSKSSSIKEISYASIFFFIGIFAVVFQYVVDAQVPGGILDSRFNLYVLEHFFLVLNGQESSFATAPFFYPFTNTIFFSDNHWGSAFIYSFFRWQDISPEKAYNVWFFIGFVVNYWACFYVLRQLKLSQLAAATGAFIFTFSLPIIAQDDHLQLLYRPFIPLSFLAAYNYAESRDSRHLAISFLFLSLQFLTSFYNGFFLLYFLAAFFAVELFFYKRKLWPKKFSCAVTIPLLISAAALFLLFAVPYLEIKKLYDLGRTWIEIYWMLPQIPSFLMADRSMLWFDNMEIFSAISMRHEHQLFIGIGGAFALLMLYLTKDFLKSETLAVKLGWSVVLIVATTMFLNPMSLYPLVLLFVPGASSLRAVNREIMVLLLPFSYLIGLSIDKIRSANFKNFSNSALIFTICTLVIIDPILARKSTSTIDDWNKRVRIFADKLPQDLDKSSILVVKTDSAFEDVDVMLLAQELGIKTINGYSGNYPDKVRSLLSCDDVKARIDQAEKFTESKLEREKLVFVGFDAKCEI